MLFCITMYNEGFNQLQQSLWGCIVSIIELIHKNDEYTADQFGIVLICDGVDKINESFIDKLTEFNLFDPNQCCHTFNEWDEFNK